MKNGDILKFSRFGYNELDKEAWGIIVDDSNDYFVFLIGHPINWENAADDSGGEIIFDSKMDTYRKINENKVPDHVWAALAKWRLTQ